ncbi:hypothetical protein DRI50_03120 [candidate division KSB1 bacterium]|nr:MAG: hypothetical protein DRI50_03120 [candidate division KSB1 bacterium]
MVYLIVQDSHNFNISFKFLFLNRIIGQTIPVAENSLILAEVNSIEIAKINASGNPYLILSYLL